MGVSRAEPGSYRSSWPSARETLEASSTGWGVGARSHGVEADFGKDHFRSGPIEDGDGVAQQHVP